MSLRSLSANGIPAPVGQASSTTSACGLLPGPEQPVCADAPAVVTSLPPVR